MDLKKLPEETATEITERPERFKELQSRSTRLDRDLLMEYGVSGEVIDMATIIRTSKDHIRFTHTQNQKGLKMGLKTPNEDDSQAGIMWGHWG